MLNFAAIDFETANNNRSSVCSVGIVIVRNGVITDKLYELVRPAPNYYSWWATDIHGLSYDDTIDLNQFPEVWHRLAPAIAGLPLVAHNSAFDESCLRKAYEHYGMEYPDYEFYCTLWMARKAFPQLINHQLGTVAEHIGFDLTNHHHALADAEACAEIMLQLL